VDGFYLGDILTDEQVKKEEKLQKEQERRDEMKAKLNDLEGYIVDDELLEKDIKAFIDFEKKLASLVRLSNDNDSLDSKSFTINEMHSEYKNIDWLKIFGEIFDFAQINITSNEHIYNNQPTYFKNIGTLLKETPK
ncbi:hypothetical protein B4U80_14829, partial [Leptotrombidium deliense]